MAKKKIPFRESSFHWLNTMLMVFICLITIYPFYYVLVISLNQGQDAIRGGLWLYPRVPTLENFVVVLMDRSLKQAYIVTISRTVIGTFTSVFFTAMFAYGISRRNLLGRNLYLTLGIFTMFFSGGLIPNFILMRWLGLLDNFWVYILPALFNFWNVIIFQGFFREIPVSMEESAKIDGANEMYIFYKIIVPVATPALACIAVFNGVWHWNAWFDAYIYTNRPVLQTVQVLLLKVINRQLAMTHAASQAAAFLGQTSVSEFSLRCATIVVAVAPIIFIYPFLQKYFTKGLVLGAVKG